VDGADVAAHYGYPADREYWIGCIVALATLADIVAGPRPGLFSWMLTDIRPLDEPVPYVGKVGLFTVDDIPAAQLRTRRRKAG
jgi:hypothetical protein